MELRRPFAPEAVKYKIQTGPKDKQSGGKTNAIVVSYIDARTAVERLNHVLGGDWSDQYTPIPNGLECMIRVGSTVRSDVGWATDTDTDTGLKALYSDAFKRAAVKFGVGVSIYALPRLYENADNLTNRGKNWYLPDRLIPGYRERYVRWLDAEGIKAFGEPLPHGDVDTSQGDIDADPVAATDDGAYMQIDPMERGRAKCLFMASALAAKTETDPQDLQTLVNAAQDADELLGLYRRFSLSLHQAGGDPTLVGKRFDEAHAEPAAA